MGVARGALRRGGSAGLISAGVVLTLLASVAGSIFASSLWVYALALSPVLLLAILRRRFNKPQLSPTVLLVGVLTACSFFGYALRGLVGSRVAGGASIAIDISEERAVQTVILFTVASVSVTVASAFVAKSPSPRFVATASSFGSSFPLPLLVSFAGVPPLLSIIGNGVDNYISRDFYLLGARGSIIGTIAIPLVTASLLLCGYLYGRSWGAQRVFVFVVALLNVSVLFAQSSRTFALAPILLALGLALNGGRRARAALLVGASLMSFLLLPLPLIFRGQRLQGLIPNWDTLIGLRLDGINWMEPVNNILIAFPLVGETAYGGYGINLSHLLISLNPLPGNSLGWDEASRELRLNAYTPTAGLGEVGALGLPIVVLVFGLFGFVLAWLERSVMAMVLSGQFIYAASVVALVALFATQIIQYNLRSGVRLLVYAACLELARRLIMAIGRASSARASGSRSSGTGPGGLSVREA